jgi:2-polyprenyl-6-hydroxyphenyl methylase/3-demethylubiquinone-9 3-methyltransferase
MTAPLNVDHAEIQKFETLASRWWDPQGEFRTLHQLNPLRLEYINSHAPLKGKKVLDVGCGGGVLAESMARQGGEVTGIDMGEGPLQVARLHLLESGLEVLYERIPVERLADERPASFDLVTCMEMLEHVPDPSSVVEACARLVKPGGQVFFSTINRNPKSYMLAVIGAEYLLRLLPRGTHDFAKFIRPSELERWCRSSGLRSQEIIGVLYNPLNGSFRLSKDIDVNYMVRCVRPDE